MVQAFRVARNQLFSEARPNVTKIAILVVDGTKDRSPQLMEVEANLTKAENVEVFCFGITSDVCICTQFHKCKFYLFYFFHVLFFQRF